MTNLFKMCLESSYIHTCGGGDYSISTDSDTIYIFFEWSDGKEDWKSNFNFPVKPYKRMEDKWYCHRGFLKVWKGMRKEIELTVSALINNMSIDRIVCVGYSHGGALSALATENFTYLYGDNIEVKGYGFGAPRVFWGFIPKAVRERMDNFVTIRNIPDIVTHLPPSLFGYRNSGHLLKIGKHFKYNPIKAHFPDIYMSELQNYKEG